MRFKEFLTEASSSSAPKVALEFQMLVPGTSAGAVKDSLVELGHDVKLHSPDSTKNKTGKGWHVQPDATLGDGGVEIQSPPLPLNDALRDLGKICDWMNEHNVTTNDSTSLRIKVVLPNISEKLDPVKLVAFMDEHAERAIRKYAGKFTAPQIEVIVNKIKQTGKLPESLGDIERDALNFLGIKMSGGVLELRVDGGSDYEHNASDLKKKIFKMVNAIEVACDAAAEKSEYVKKLLEILSAPEDMMNVTKNDMHQMPEHLHRLYKFNAHMNDAWKTFDKDQVHGDARHSLLVMINIGLKTAHDFKTLLNLPEKTFFKKLAKQVSLQSSDVDAYYRHDHIARLNFKKEIGL